MLEGQLFQSIPVWILGPSFVHTIIISVPFVYGLMLHVHQLYFIVCNYLTQLRCFTYYYLHYMYAILFSSSPQMLSL